MTHPRLSPREAHARLSEGYIHLDVRTEEEFAAGHSAGAFNVPIRIAAIGGMQDNPRFVQVVLACFGHDTKLVISCRSGQRSLLAARLLLEAGVRELVEQRAGFHGARNAFGMLAEPGWQSEGLPCATAAEPGRSYADLCARLSED